MWSSVWSGSFLREGLYDLHSCSQPCSLALSPSAMGSLSSPFLEDHVVEEQCWAISITETGRTQGIADPGNSTHFIQQACSDPSHIPNKAHSKTWGWKETHPGFCHHENSEKCVKVKGLASSFHFYYGKSCLWIAVCFPKPSFTVLHCATWF